MFAIFTLLILFPFYFMLTTSGVAVSTGGQLLLTDPFFQMLAFCFGRIMFVAVVAGVLCVSGCVASFAGNFTLIAMIEREDVLA